MSFKPFKSIGDRKFINLSGSGTLETVGNTYLGGTLNVSGAVTLSGPASGSAAGSGSYLGVSSAGLAVLTKPEAKVKKPVNCRFTSSAADTITLTPAGIDSRAIVPVISGSDLLNIQLTSDLSMDFTAANGAGGLDTGTVTTTDQGYYVFLITKANGAGPALMGSLSRTAPTMPATYTYKSLTLFWALYGGGSGAGALLPFANSADGWTSARRQVATGLTSTSATYVDISEFVPVSGTMGINTVCRNTGGNSRVLYIYQEPVGVNNATSRGGTSFWYVERLGKTSNGVDNYITMCYTELPVPDSASGKQIGYDWSGGVTTGANFVLLGWKTEAYT